MPVLTGLRKLLEFSLVTYGWFNSYYYSVFSLKKMFSVCLILLSLLYNVFEVSLMDLNQNTQLQKLVMIIALHTTLSFKSRQSTW